MGATIAHMSSTNAPASDCEPAPAASATPPPEETKTLASAEYDSQDIDELVIAPASDCELVPAASAPPPPEETKTLASAEYDSQGIDELVRRLIAALFKSVRYFGFPTGQRTAIIKVSNVSLEATERDIKELFDYCGGIKSVEMYSDNEMSQIAYVTFRSIRGAETAVLLSGAIIVDKPVTIAPAPKYILVPPLEEIRREESRLMNCLSSLPKLDREACQDLGERLTHQLKEIESRKRI